MTAIRGVYGAVDELGAAYRNQAEDVRSMLYHALGGLQGIQSGFVMSTVGGAMQVSFTAGRALIEERGVDLTGDSRGYHVFADTATVVPFAAASVADRCDAVVFAWPDPQYGAIGSGLVAGPQIIVVEGVSGSTTPRTDSEISTAVGPGGWFRYADVVVESTDTEISPANITLTYPDASEFIGGSRGVVKSTAEVLTAGGAIQNDDELFLSVTDGATYQLDVGLLWYVPNSGSDSLHVQLTHPGGTVMSGFPRTPFSGGVSSVSPSVSVPIAQGAGGSYNFAVMHHTYVCTASGVLHVQWGGMLAPAGDVTVEQGSYIRATRIG